jgi:hypothetical protein
VAEAEGLFHMAPPVVPPMMAGVLLGALLDMVLLLEVVLLWLAMMLSEALVCYTVLKQVEHVCCMVLSEQRASRPLMIPHHARISAGFSRNQSLRSR